MYDAPFDALTRIGWSLAGVVVVLFVVRAVRLERAHRGGVARAPDLAGRVVGVLSVVVVLALVVDLLVLVRTVLG